MADNGDSAGTKVVATLAAFGAAFITRKVLVFGWKKITGHEPPGEQDPSVSWAEALGWAVVVGVSISAARMAATRAVSKNMRRAPAGEIQE
jgi:Protein of unknown function (DUF4235)